MTSIETRITDDDTPPGCVRVEVYADKHFHVGTLAMSPGQAAELVARIDAGEPTSSEITPDAAAHVLYHYGETGGMEPGSFIKALIAALVAADRTNHLRMSTVYPPYALAVHLARDTEGGVRWL